VPFTTHYTCLNGRCRDDFRFTFAFYCYTVVVFETAFQSVSHQFDKRNMSNLRIRVVSHDYRKWESGLVTILSGNASHLNLRVSDVIIAYLEGEKIQLDVLKEKRRIPTINGNRQMIYTTIHCYFITLF